MAWTSFLGNEQICYGTFPRNDDSQGQQNWAKKYYGRLVKRNWFGPISTSAILRLQLKNYKSYVRLYIDVIRILYDKFDTLNLNIEVKFWVVTPP